MKILAKILAITPEKVLPTVIHEDQTGFMKNRQLFHNLRRLFTSGAFFLDAEKAFDRVEWDYLFSALSKFGFGAIFISWIGLLYVSPLASVHTNNLRSGHFPLTRSTRLGYPLSPMLFALAIESLAISLGTSTSYSGIGRAEH